MNPSWRKPAGIFLIMAIILVWSVIVVSLIDLVGTLHWLLQIPIYVAAGIAWILPLKPLLLWMETGKWRE